MDAASNPAKAIPFRIIERADTLDLREALTLAWNDGTETVEIVSQALGEHLRSLESADLWALASSEVAGKRDRDPDGWDPSSGW